MAEAKTQLMTCAGSEWVPEHGDNFGAFLHTTSPGMVL